MADDKEVFDGFVLVEELLEVGQGGGGGEGAGEQDLGLVAGLGAEERGGLEAALEGARDDEIELDLEVGDDVRELEAVALAVAVEGSFDVEEGVGPAGAGTGMAKDEQIHRTVTILSEVVASRRA